MYDNQIQSSLVETKFGFGRGVHGFFMVGGYMESLDNKWILKGDREGDEEDHCKEKIKYQKNIFTFVFVLSFSRSSSLALLFSHSFYFSGSPPLLPTP